MIKATGKTQAQLDEQAEREAQERINREAREYLAETDWYVVRELDTGVAMPDEVRQKRAEARKSVM